MKTLIIGLFVSLTLTHVAIGQVDEIKKESASHSEARSGRSSSGSWLSSDDSSSPGAGLMADVVVNFFTFTMGGVATWQKHRLDQKKDNPSIVSFDVILQGAVQPSTYYIVQPRVRANWGLFSTDFRLNY